MLILQMLLVSAIITLLVSTSLAFSPQILSIEHQILKLTQRNNELSRIRAKPIPSQVSPHSDNLPLYINTQLRFTSKCYHAFFFQTVSNVYFVINHPLANSISFYNYKCEELSTLEGVQIREILCDRGICQSGLLHFIAKDTHLYSTSEDKNFTVLTNLANLQGSNIIGGILRNRGKDKIEIYISSQDGTIRVFDESGVNKLRIDLEGFNTKILTIRDHHPYPIIIMQNYWISMLDTAKYTEILPNCPHIAGIKYVLSENYYGQAVFILTPNKIYLVDFELSKRSCIIKREYDLQIELGNLSRVSFFSNTIFIDDKVYNLTERKLYRLDVANQSSLNFIYKKSQSEEIYSLKQWCDQVECNVELFEIRKMNEDRSILFWLTIAFIAILFLSISFMKKSSINNLELDDPTRFKEREIQQQIFALTNQAKEANNQNKKAALKSGKKQS